MSKDTTPDTTPPSSTATGIQRRTLVGAAAWAAPAIAMITASPAAAASGTLGIITFLTESQQIDGGTTLVLTGTVTPADGGELPAELTINYSGALTGPLTVAVSGGTFSLVITASNPDADVPSVVTATAPDYAPTEYECTVHPAAALGVITMTSTPDSIPQGFEMAATGRLTAGPGAALPTHVTIVSGSPAVASVPATALVKADGTFSFPITAAAADGEAMISVSAVDYGAASFIVHATSAAIEAGLRFDPQRCGYDGSNVYMKWEETLSIDASGVVTQTLRGAFAERVGARIYNHQYVLLNGKAPRDSGVSKIDFRAVVTVKGGSRLEWWDASTPSNTQPLSNKGYTSFMNESGRTSQQSNEERDQRWSRNMQRASRTDATHPGGTMTTVFTFPGYPKFRGVFEMTY